jgi:hypothetical protein
MIPIGQPNQSNDLGEFRIFGLPAGDYTVAAVPQSRFGAMPTNASTVPATTYFPGTADIEAATPVSVTANQSTSGLELRLVSVAAYRVSGIVVDSAGNPVAGAMVMLMPDRRQVMPLLGAVTGNARSGPNGAFALDGVPAGTYRASATVPVASGSGGVVRGFTGGIGSADSSSEVVVADGNVTGVRIVVQGR